MSEPVSDAGSTADALQPGLGNVLFDAWLVSRGVHALIDDAIRSSGLDADEFAVYSVLAGDSGMTPTALADWMAAPATTVSSYVKRFERRGHVRRVPNPGDRRSHVIELTAEGRAAHQAAGELFLPLLAEVNGSLGADAAEIETRLLDLRRTIDDLAGGSTGAS